VAKKFGLLGAGKDFFKTVEKRINTNGTLDYAKNMLATGTKESLKVALFEGLAETAQAIIGEDATRRFYNNWEKLDPKARKDAFEYLVTPEQAKKYGLNFAGGFVMGGLMGGPGGAFQAHGKYREAEGVNAAVDAKKQQEAVEIAQQKKAHLAQTF
jgi:hypothetical protein